MNNMYLCSSFIFNVSQNIVEGKDIWWLQIRMFILVVMTKCFSNQSITKLAGMKPNDEEKLLLYTIQPH